MKLYTRLFGKPEKTFDQKVNEFRAKQKARHISHTIIPYQDEKNNKWHTKKIAY